MYRASADDRGTVQALARDLEAAREDAGIQFQLSARSEIAMLPSHLYSALLQNLRLRFPNLPNLLLHSFLSRETASNSVSLLPKGVLFDHVVVKHTRYTASSRATSDAGYSLALRSLT
ncbi:hypothetical protein B0H11DRAFT_1209603 [Mycena galericulata]|nr:hypothetical protein B0H11DRAFT_1209603 [Mycena galericulata]